MIANSKLLCSGQVVAALKVQLLESELSCFDRRSATAQQEHARRFPGGYRSDRDRSDSPGDCSRQSSTVNADQQHERKIPRLLIAHRLMISSSADLVVAQACAGTCSGANRSNTPQGLRPMRSTLKAVLSLPGRRAGVLVSGAELCPCVSTEYPRAAIR